MDGARDCDQLGLVLHFGPQLPEQRILEIVARHSLAVRAREFPRENIEPLGCGNRQRPPQQSVHKPEGSVAGSNREPERMHGRGRRRLSFEKLPPAENCIGAQRFDPRDEPDIAAPLAVRQCGAKRAPSLARVSSFRNCFRDVQLQLFLDLPVQPVPAKAIGNARPQRHIGMDI
uniref:Uncharacterized protein n=1 Tax=Solibacter usitatus (strain Ellin6076) TaxID=234267 RepID=Q01ZN7_SOLUE